MKGPPQKAGPAATQVGKQEEDSESSSEEESDSEGEAPAQVRLLPVSFFFPPQCQEPPTRTPTCCLCLPSWFLVSLHTAMLSAPSPDPVCLTAGKVLRESPPGHSCLRSCQGPPSEGRA